MTFSSCDQRLVDLLRAGILFLAGGGDLLHQFRRSLDIGHQFLEHFAGFLRYLDRRARELVDLARRFLAALGQLAHFRRHHGEAFAMFPGARRFDGRVQGQQVGLARDLLNDRDLAGDLLHRRHRLHHRLAAFLRVLGRFVGDLVGLLRVVGILLDVRNHLLHRGRSFLGRSRLGSGALRYLNRSRADGLAGRCHLAGDGADVRYHPRDAAHHRTQRLHELVLRRTVPA